MALTTQSSSAGGRIFLLLFSLPFLGIGLFVGGLAVKKALDWHHAQSWQGTPAQILETALESHHDSGHGTTCSVTVRYAYSWSGVRHEGTRVSACGGSDSDSSRHRHAELERCRNSGGAFRAFVNPAAPGESVLYREFETGQLLMPLLFGLVFAGAGLFMFTFGWKTARAAGQQRRLQEQHSGQPWRWKPDWAAGRICHSGRATFWFAFLFAAFWNAISAPLLFVIPNELAKGNKPVLIALLFPLVGLGLASWAVLAFIRWRKFGDSVVELAAIPGVPGLPLRGVLTVSMPEPPANGFVLCLNCIRSTTTGSGKNRHTTETVLWQDERQVQPSRGDRRGNIRVPVDFDLPADQPSASPPGSPDASTVLWRLTARADLPGADYAATFDLPVFADAAPESGPAAGQLPAPAHSSLRSMPADAAPAPVDWAKAGIRFETRANGTRTWYFPAARLKGVAAVSILIFLVWTGILVGIVIAKAPLIFPVVWALFDLLFAWNVVEMLFRSSVIQAGHGAVTWRSGYFGGGREQSVPVAEIASVTPEQSMQAGNSFYYNLKLRDSRGRAFIIARNLAPLALAKRLAEELHDGVAGSTR